MNSATIGTSPMSLGPGSMPGNFFIWARRAHNKTVVASQGASTDSRFKEEKLWLELSDGDENWHERWL